MEMSNPFYFGQKQNLMQMVQQIKQNPFGFVARMQFNIPQNISNDPNAILQHLLSSGQVSQQTVNNAYQMMRNFKN